MKVVVLSPHLDDAVLSVGATMHSLVRRGVDVELVTVFAGDPAPTPGPASYWDAKRGLADKSAVVAARREEDSDAARVLGVRSTWLPFDDGAYVAPRDPEHIWSMIAPFLVMASAVLVPGWPLVHADHRFTTMLVLQRMQTGVPLFFYAEMPYASHPSSVLRSVLRGRRAAPLFHAHAVDLTWRPTAVTSEDRRAKRAAVECYRGEIESLGREARRSALYERIVRKELLGDDRSATPPPGLFGGT